MKKILVLIILFYSFSANAENAWTPSTNPLFLFESAANPSAVANRGAVYTKDAAGITQLFYRASDGTVSQLSPLGSGSGDVVGPASSTDNCFARFDTGTGKLIQNSVVCATDLGGVSGITTLNASGKITAGEVEIPGTNEGLAIFNGSVLESVVATNGQIAIGNTATTPIVSTITPTTFQTTITNGAGSITVGLDTTASLAGNPGLSASGIAHDSTDGGLLFEGLTANTLEGVLVSADIAGVDKTWTLPNTTGTIVTTGDSGTVTTTMILNDTVGTADIDETAGYTWSALVGMQTFASGVAATAGSYQCGRDADATNQYHCNVPTGATMEWSVNDVPTAILSTTGLSIGAAAPTSTLDLSVAAASDPRVLIFDGDNAQPITGTYASTVVGAIDVISSTNGGITISGLSDSNTNPLALRGMVGSSGAVGSAGAVVIKAVRSDGGTGFTTLSLTDTLLRVENNTSARLMLRGNGDLGTNGTPSAGLHIAPLATTNSTNQGVLFVASANTTQPTTAEVSQVKLDMSSTRNWTAGTVALQRDFFSLAGTYGATGASTFTRVAHAEFDRAPNMGTNVTATSASILALGSAGTSQATSAAFNYRGLRLLDHTLTMTGSTADITSTTNAMVSIGQLTVANSVGAQQFTKEVSSLYIKGPPIAGTNVTFAATPLSLNIASGGAHFGGAVDIAGNIGFYGVAPVVQVDTGDNMTNNVTSGGTIDVVANYTDLTTYANDSAAIRNNLFRITEKLKKLDDALRLNGLVN